MHLPCTQRMVGFTIVELIFVIVMVSILSVYAMMRSYSTGELSLPSQAQKMASDIRHAQTLATTQGKRLRITITAAANGNYKVLPCTVNAGVVTCTATPVTDPVTGAGFSVNLKNGVVLAGTATLDFSSLGQPLDSSGASTSASYTLTSGSVETITVAALTGYVTVAP